MIQTDGNAMFLEGQLEDGRVVLDAPTDLPNGTRVRVEPVPLLVDPPPKKSTRIDRTKADCVPPGDQSKAGT
ncbi:MAG: hypothetical protein EXS09_16695 [Gemmataceae bacterium]|nr:hypothetical protein [Gemmataceae bacterium]